MFVQQLFLYSLLVTNFYVQAMYDPYDFWLEAEGYSLFSPLSYAPTLAMPDDIDVVQIQDSFEIPTPVRQSPVQFMPEIESLSSVEYNKPIFSEILTVPVQANKFAGIMQSILLQEPTEWNREAMKVVLQQRTNRCPCTVSLIHLLKSVIYKNVITLKNEIDETQVFYNSRGRFGLVYISILLSPLHSASEEQLIELLSWLKNTILNNVKAGTCVKQRNFCLRLINTALECLEKKDSTLFNLLIYEHPDIAHILERYAQRVMNCRYQKCDNVEVVPCMLSIDVRPNMDDAMHITENTIDIDKLFSKCPHYDPLLYFLYHYFTGHSPFDLLTYIDYSLSRSHSYATFLNKLKKKVLQEYGDNTGKIRVSEEKLNMHELLKGMVDEYHFEIYCFIQRLQYFWWNLNTLDTIIDSFAMVHYQTHEFLQSLRYQIMSRQQ